MYRSLYYLSSHNIFRLNPPKLIVLISIVISNNLGKYALSVIPTFSIFICNIIFKMLVTRTFPFESYPPDRFPEVKVLCQRTFWQIAFHKWLFQIILSPKMYECSVPGSFRIILFYYLLHYFILICIYLFNQRIWLFPLSFFFPTLFYLFCKSFIHVFCLLSVGVLIFTTRTCIWI